MTDNDTTGSERQRHQSHPELCKSTKVIDGTEYKCERKFGHGGQHSSGTAAPGLIASWDDTYTTDNEHTDSNTLEND